MTSGISTLSGVSLTSVGASSTQAEIVLTDMTLQVVLDIAADDLMFRYR